MPDFSHLLKRPADSFRKPPTLPAGTYDGLIMPGFELAESSQKKTPYVRFQVRLTAPGADIEPSSLLDETGQPIDISRRTYRLDFYLTDDATYRFNEFCESVGVDYRGRSLEQLFPEVCTKAVKVTLVQRMGQDGKEMFNEIKEVVGQG